MKQSGVGVGGYAVKDADNVRTSSTLAATTEVRGPSVAVAGKPSPHHVLIPRPCPCAYGMRGYTVAALLTVVVEPRTGCNHAARASDGCMYPRSPPSSVL